MGRSGGGVPQGHRTGANNVVAYNDLGVALHRQGKLDEAEIASRKAVGLQPDVFLRHSNLGYVLLDRGKLEEAEAAFRKAMKLDSRSFGSGGLASLGLTLLKQMKYADAEPLLRNCLKIREQKQPDDWTTFNTKSMLGGSLLGQKKYAEAEPLLHAGYEGMRQRTEKIPPEGKIRLTEAVERLVQFYEATDNKDKAADWRKQREQLKEPPKP